MRNHPRQSRPFTRLAIALAVAVVAVPSAAAHHDQSDALPERGKSLRSITGYPSAVAAEAGRSYGLMPNARGSKRRPAHTDQPGRAVSKADGFHWGDASMGAGFAWAVALLGAGVLLTIREGSRMASPPPRMEGRS